MTAFCPVPHTPRDQFWVAAGIGLGVSGALLVSRLIRPNRPEKVHVLLVQAEFATSGDKQAWKHRWASCAAAVRAREPRCLSYELSDSTVDPKRAIIFERYLSKADLEGAHQETLKQFSQTAPPFEGAPPRMTLSHYTESNIGHMQRS